MVCLLSCPTPWLPAGWLPMLWDPTCLSCDIHKHTPAKKNYTDFRLYPFVYESVLQTVLGMGMGMNVTAHYRSSNFGRFLDFWADLRFLDFLMSADWDLRCYPVTHHALSSFCLVECSPERILGIHFARKTLSMRTDHFEFHQSFWARARRAGTHAEREVINHPACGTCVTPTTARHGLYSDLARSAPSAFQTCSDTGTRCVSSRTWPHRVLASVPCAHFWYYCYHHYYYHYHHY